MAFAICNVGGRLMAVASPLVAEKAIPLPMETFCVMALIGLVLSLFVQTSEDKEEQVARITLTRTTGKSGGGSSGRKTNNNKAEDDNMLMDTM